MLASVRDMKAGGYTRSPPTRSHYANDRNICRSEHTFCHGEFDIRESWQKLVNDIWTCVHTYIHNGDHTDTHAYLTLSRGGCQDEFENVLTSHTSKSIC